MSSTEIGGDPGRGRVTCEYLVCNCGRDIFSHGHRSPPATPVLAIIPHSAKWMIVMDVVLAYAVLAC